MKAAGYSNLLPEFRNLYGVILFMSTERNDLRKVNNMKKFIAWIAVFGMLLAIANGCTKKRNPHEKPELLPTSHIQEIEKNTTDEQCETIVSDQNEGETTTVPEEETEAEGTLGPTEEQILEIETVQTEPETTEPEMTEPVYTDSIELPEEEV